MYMLNARSELYNYVFVSHVPLHCSSLHSCDPLPLPPPPPLCLTHQRSGRAHLPPGPRGTEREGEALGSCTEEGERGDMTTIHTCI